jgi:hypothetical protein
MKRRVLDRGQVLAHGTFNGDSASKNCSTVRDLGLDSARKNRVPAGLNSAIMAGVWKQIKCCSPRWHSLASLISRVNLRPRDACWSIGRTLKCFLANFALIVASTLSAPGTTAPITAAQITNSIIVRVSRSDAASSEEATATETRNCAAVLGITRCFPSYAISQVEGESSRAPKTSGAANNRRQHHNSACAGPGGGSV